MHPPTVLVVYNEPVLPRDHPDAESEHDIIETVETTVKILTEVGFGVRQVGVSFDPQILLNQIRDQRPDVVFNLFEGLATQTGTEISVAALLEWMNIPFTGSPSHAIALGRDKIRTKLLMQGAGLPTAAFQVIDRMPGPRWPSAYPVIVKPAYQDSSVGIDQSSVVTNQKELDDRVADILERYGPPVLVEQFVFGREFHASVIDEPGHSPLTPKPMTIPLTEICFTFEPGKRYWPIYSYAAKWDTESVEHIGTPHETPVYLEPEIMNRINGAALKAYRLLGLRDYGRIDLRLTEEGEPYILEGNPNPYLNGIGLIKGLEAMGKSHPQFVADLVWGALTRGGKM